MGGGGGGGGDSEDEDEMMNEEECDDDFMQQDLMNVNIQMSNDDFGSLRNDAFNKEQFE